MVRKGFDGLGFKAVRRCHYTIRSGGDEMPRLSLVPPSYYFYSYVAVRIVVLLCVWLCFCSFVYFCSSASDCVVAANMAKTPIFIVSCRVCSDRSVLRLPGHCKRFPAGTGAAHSWSGSGRYQQKPFPAAKFTLFQRLENPVQSDGIGLKRLDDFQQPMMRDERMHRGSDGREKSGYEDDPADLRCRSWEMEIKWKRSGSK